MSYQTDEFEIRWFRENTTGAVEDLGHGYPNKSQNNMFWFSRYHDKDFFNQQYNSSYLGKYWCQVINTTANPDQPLMRSNVFTLLAPENYTQPTCVNQGTSTQTVDNIQHVLIYQFTLNRPHYLLLLLHWVHTCQWTLINTVVGIYWAAQQQVRMLITFLILSQLCPWL